MPRAYSGHARVRHRQTKGAATAMLGLPPLRHTPTLPGPATNTGAAGGRLSSAGAAFGAGNAPPNSAAVAPHVRPARADHPSRPPPDPEDPADPHSPDEAAIFSAFAAVLS